MDRLSHRYLPRVQVCKRNSNNRVYEPKNGHNTVRMERNTAQRTWKDKKKSQRFSVQGSWRYQWWDTTKNRKYTTRFTKVVPIRLIVFLRASALQTMVRSHYTVSHKKHVEKVSIGKRFQKAQLKAGEVKERRDFDGGEPQKENWQEYQQAFSSYSAI